MTGYKIITVFGFIKVVCSLTVLVNITINIKHLLVTLLNVKIIVNISEACFPER